MDLLSKKISNLGIHDLRNAARFAQNKIIQYEPYQVDIRKATNTDSWGPTPKQLNKVLRNRNTVPIYLIIEYTMKRLVDHMAKKPKNLYEKARKEFVNYGNEWRVVLKCLLVLEHLLLKCNLGQELDQALSCLNTHKHILTRDTMQFKVEFSNDGKMEIHERGIKKKCEQLIQFIEEPAYLKRTKAEHMQQLLKVNSSGVEFSLNASYIDNDIHISDDSFIYEASSDFNECRPYSLRASGSLSVSSTQRHKKDSIAEEQRRKRREILRGCIKNTEKQRKASIIDKQQPIEDLLVLDDFEETGGEPSEKVAKEDNDDDFGEFQTEQQLSISNMDVQGTENLLDWNGISTPLTTTSTNSITVKAKNTKGIESKPTGDAFANLFSYSKTHI